MNGPKSGAETLLGMALLLLASAFVLRWAWQIVRPLVPVLVVVMAVGIVVRLVFRRRDGW